MRRLLQILTLTMVLGVSGVAQEYGKKIKKSEFKKLIIGTWELQEYTINSKVISEREFERMRFSEDELYDDPKLEDGRVHINTGRHERWGYWSFFSDTQIFLIRENFYFRCKLIKMTSDTLQYERVGKEGLIGFLFTKISSN